MSLGSELEPVAVPGLLEELQEAMLPLAEPDLHRMALRLMLLEERVKELEEWKAKEVSQRRAPTPLQRLSRPLLPARLWRMLLQKPL